jgi:hypothetical protein
MRVNDRIRGSVLVRFHARTRRLAGMPSSRTQVSPSGSACPIGIIPTVLAT